MKQPARVCVCVRARACVYVCACACVLFPWKCCSCGIVYSQAWLFTCDKVLVMQFVAPA